MIIVDDKINRGKPSIKAKNGGHVTVKGVVNFINGGLNIEECAEEMGISSGEVHLAIEYVKLYPEVMT